MLPEDVASLAHDVLRHRLVLTYEALAEGVDADTLLDQVLDAVDAPAVSLSQDGRVRPRLDVAPANERTAARPGPGPTPAAVLRALDLTIRRRIDSLVAGEHRAPALGSGTELAQVRPYQLGDDVRQIDWA